MRAGVDAALLPGSLGSKVEKKIPVPGMRLFFKLAGGHLPASRGVCVLLLLFIWYDTGTFFSIFCKYVPVPGMAIPSPSMRGVPSYLLPLPFLLFVLFSSVHQRKRKADGGFAVPSAKSRSAEAKAQHPSARGSSSHGRSGGCAAAASSSCTQQHQEEEEVDGRLSCRRGGGGSSLRERSSRGLSRKIEVGIGREALERLKRCNVPPSAVSEHDVDDRDDPVSCAEYVVDMYKRFKELEVRLRSEAINRKLRVRNNGKRDNT